MENIIEITLTDLDIRIDNKLEDLISIWQRNDLITVKFENAPNLIAALQKILNEQKKQLA